MNYGRKKKNTDERLVPLSPSWPDISAALGLFPPFSWLEERGTLVRSKQTLSPSRIFTSIRLYILSRTHAHKKIKLENFALPPEKRGDILALELEIVWHELRPA